MASLFLTDQQLRAMNPWWTQPSGWERSDPHLSALAERPIRLPLPFVEALGLDRPGLHTVRGPRQVGKSTGLKLLVTRAIAAGFSPRQILYVAMDLLAGQPLAVVDQVVRRARDLAGAADEPGLVLMDEITAVEHWDMAVKFMWDQGLLRRDVAVCTGSSAYDIRRGAIERWPGRRGEGRDHLVLPMSMATFARAVFPTVPASPGLGIGDLLTPEGRTAISDTRVHGPELERAMELYLGFGGLPAAVAEAASGAVEPSAGARQLVRDSVVKEVLRQGASEPAAYALLDRVRRSLGSKLSWTSLAQDLGLPIGSERRGHFEATPISVRSYVEFLAASYLLLIVYYWRPGMIGQDLSRDKKVYFADPLLHTIARDYAGGVGADLPELVENLVALTLYRRCEPESFQTNGFVEPSRLHVWSSSRGSEIDFVAGPRDDLHAVEVKYRRRVDRRQLAGARTSVGGRVIVATRSDLDLEGDTVMVPAHLLTWALG